MREVLHPHVFWIQQLHDSSKLRLAHKVQQTLPLHRMQITDHVQKQMTYPFGTAFLRSNVFVNIGATSEQQMDCF